MVGISVATIWEWNSILSIYNIENDNLKTYPFGEYFIYNAFDKQLLFYLTNTRKVNSSAGNQYMICKFTLEKIIVIGTCAGIDSNLKVLDIVIPNKAVQYDCTVKEIEPLIKKSFNVELNLSILNFEYKTGIIGTADKAVVMWEDYITLSQNDITIADTESAGVAYVCMKNKIPCIICKGISDFPKNQSYKDGILNNEQFNTYLENTPKVMIKILKEYLPKLI